MPPTGYFTCPCCGQHAQHAYNYRGHQLNICTSCYDRSPAYQNDRALKEKAGRKLEKELSQSTRVVRHSNTGQGSGVGAFLGLMLLVIGWYAWPYIEPDDDLTKGLRQAVAGITLPQGDKDRLDSIVVTHRKVTFSCTISLRSMGATKAQWREAMMKANAAENVYHSPWNGNYFEEVWIFNDEDGSYIGKTSDKVFLKDGELISEAINLGGYSRR